MDKEVSAHNIKITPDQFNDPEELKNQLLGLYLGDSGDIFLDCPQDCVNLLDAIFDEIIAENGIRSVFFHYQRKVKRSQSN